MAAVGHQRAGKGARWSVGATLLRFGKWDCKRRADDLPTDNFESGGEEQGTIGFAGTDWNGDGFWDAQQNAFDTPPALFPQDSLATLKFYLNVADNVFWSIATARVLSAGNSVDCKQLVGFNASGKSNGGVVLPTGSA